MKEIELTKGYTAFVDDDDFERVSKLKWRANVRSNGVYAMHGYRVGNKMKHIGMHRFVMNAPDGVEVDHIDRCTCNNQKSNLRLASRSQNAKNRKISSKNTTGYIGVTIFRKKYRAFVFINKRIKWIGYFDTAIEAARARDASAREHYGEFANLNFPDNQI